VLPETGALAVGATDAVKTAGGEVVDASAAEALVWGAPGIEPDLAERLRDILGRYPSIRWVQLPWAGVEQYASMGLFDHGHLWTSAKGLYARPVAEHALALTLACLRHLKAYSRADRWTGQAGRTLFDARVTIFGGGGIAQELIRLLDPFGCHITVVRRRPEPVDGAAVLGWARRREALPGADAVILALALTDETVHCFGTPEFEVMKSLACLVNVARGRHIVTDALVDALTAGAIGTAGLDVTDPEPLPDGHPLWALPNCLITPHTANTEEMAVPALQARIEANVRRWAAGQSLEGLVDPDLGY
jgi:phosphoglycerate dehydrogenase-like enzyme